MALITKPSITQMISELKDSSSFTYSQCESIIDYLWDLSEECGEDMVFCPTAIRCDVNFMTWDELSENYRHFGDCEDNDELLESLQDYTSLIHYDDGGVLFFCF
jgi:hypothetical protein